MKLTIESTNITTRIDDVPVRLWEGVGGCDAGGSDDSAGKSD